LKNKKRRTIVHYTWQEREKKEKKRHSKTIRSPYAVVRHITWKKAWWCIKKDNRKSGLATRWRRIHATWMTRTSPTQWLMLSTRYYFFYLKIKNITLKYQNTPDDPGNYPKNWCENTKIPPNVNLIFCLI